MKTIFIILVALFVSTTSSIGQATEIECTVYRRYGAYITLTPAHYDAGSLPQVGEKVMLSLYIKDNLPINKKEGYYELFVLEVVKLIPDTKSVTFKAEENIEMAKAKHGIESMSLNSESKVKISWAR